MQYVYMLQICTYGYCRFTYLTVGHQKFSESKKDNVKLLYFHNLWASRHYTKYQTIPNLRWSAWKRWSVKFYKIMTMYILIHVPSSQLAYHTRFRRESGDLFSKGEGGGMVRRNLVVWSTCTISDFFSEAGGLGSLRDPRSIFRTKLWWGSRKWSLRSTRIRVKQHREISLNIFCSRWFVNDKYALIWIDI